MLIMRDICARCLRKSLRFPDVHGAGHLWPRWADPTNIVLQGDIPLQHSIPVPPFAMWQCPSLPCARLQRIAHMAPLLLQVWWILCR